MIRVSLLLCFFAFGLAISDRFEELTKETATKRLLAIDQRHHSLIANFTAHGMDFYVQELKKQNFTDFWFKWIPSSTPEDYKDLPRAFHPCLICQHIKFAEEFLNDPLEMSREMLEESSKGRGLYYAATERTYDENSISAKKAEKEALELINAENQFKSFSGCRSANDENANKEQKRMFKLRHELSLMGVLNAYRFLELENEANEQIQRSKRSHRLDEIAQTSQALAVFLELDYQMNKIFPIDSEIRMNQYLHAAMKHYKQYKILYDLVH